MLNKHIVFLLNETDVGTIPILGIPVFRHTKFGSAISLIIANGTLLLNNTHHLQFPNCTCCVTVQTLLTNEKNVYVLRRQ